MFRDVVTTGQGSQEWPALRDRISARILGTIGAVPQLDRRPAEWREEFVEDGLRVRTLRLEHIPGFPLDGALLMPAGGVVRGGILCIHGTDHELAHRNVMRPQERPHRAYAIELARLGFATLTIDQIGFGASTAGSDCGSCIQRFYASYPDWSLDGARLACHRRAVDILVDELPSSHPVVGCIGHSLGGRAALFLASFDERVGAAVISTGVSPNATNVFRNQPSPMSLSPLLDREVARSGRPTYEYQELLALVAPRHLLLLEPWNDACNPYIEAVFRCFERARHVWSILGPKRRSASSAMGPGTIRRQ